MWCKDWLVSWWIWNQHSPEKKWAGDWIRSKSDQVTLFHHNLTTSLFERKFPYSKIKTYLKRRGASALSRRYSESLDICFFINSFWCFLCFFRILSLKIVLQVLKIWEGSLTFRNFPMRSYVLNAIGYNYKSKHLNIWCIPQKWQQLVAKLF